MLRFGVLVWGARTYLGWSHEPQVISSCGFFIHVPHRGHGSEETLQDFSAGVEPVNGVWLLQFLYKLHINVALGFSLSVKFGNFFPPAVDCTEHPGEVGMWVALLQASPECLESLRASSLLLISSSGLGVGMRESRKNPIKM